MAPRRSMTMPALRKYMPARRARLHGRALGDEVLVREQIAPGVVADDVIVRVAGAEAALQTGEEAVVDRQRLRQPFAGELEAVREKVVGVAAGVFAAEGAVGMHEMRGEADRLFQRGLELRARA